jgi:hypothetical protein
VHIASFALNTLISFFVIKGWPKLSRGAGWRSFFYGICIFSSMVLLLEGLLYVLTPSYFNYTEVNLVNISAYWLKGHEIFTPIGSPERYSVLYGPWTTIMNSIFLIPGFCVLQASKLSGYLHLLLTLGLFGFLLRRKFSRDKVFIFGLLCLAFLGFDNYSYVIRPDSFIIAYVFTAFFLFEILPDRWMALAYIVTGGLMGLSVACKIHGFIYFLPIFFHGFNRNKTSKHIACSALTIGIGIGISLAPFLLQGVSFKNYGFWLHSTSKHGLSLNLFTDCLTYGIPMLISLYLCGVAKSEKMTSYSLIVSFFTASVFGSLVGAGTHHLMPFFPMIIYLCAVSYKNLGSNERKRTHIFVSAVLVALIYDAFNSQKAMVKYFKTVPTQVEQFTDLKILRAKIPGRAELGYGNNAQLEMSYYKPYFVAKGDPLLVDCDALMDMAASHLEIPEATYTTLKSCSIPYFILPKGSDIWNLDSGYGYPVFPQKFRDVFLAYYKPVLSSEFYTAYKCLAP